MADYYNEIDSYCVAWLQNLIKAKLIAEGDVDSRSITEVSADDIKGYTQCHFFAGIGGWPYALRLAGVSDDQQVWTGSCPCQPFSNAGKRKGFDDERHLWPEFARLIGDCQPPIVFGEQVASKAGREWLSVVRSDLEALGYAVGAADLCAASVGAPHIRQRLWWVAYPECDLREPWRVAKQSAESFGAESFRTHAELGRCGDTSFLANSVGKGLEIEREQSTREEFPASERSGALSGCAREQGSANSGLGFPHSAGPLSRCEAASAAGHWDSVITAGWDDIEWLPCIDGKWRPVKSGIFPLAHGVSGRMVARSSRQQSSAEIPEENWYSRVGALRAFGNAIVPQVAAEFIKAAMSVAP